MHMPITDEGYAPEVRIPNKALTQCWITEGHRMLHSHVPWATYRIQCVTRQ